MNNLHISHVNKSQITDDVRKWHAKLWDKQDAVYLGKELVESWGSHDSSVQYFLAFDEDKPVGILKMEVDYGVGMIDSLIIEPDYRSQGIGTKLMQECMKYSESHGLFYLWLETRQDWEEAIRMYEKYGFELTQTMPVYYYGVEWIRMGKVMPAGKQ